MESLWEKVVLPEEDGPAIITNLQLSFLVIIWAICPIRCSIKAS
jgi:hypothetical protein